MTSKITDCLAEQQKKYGSVSAKMSALDEQLELTQPRAGAKQSATASILSKTFSNASSVFARQNSRFSAYRQDSGGRRDLCICAYAWLVTLALVMSALLSALIYYDYAVRRPQYCMTKACVNVGASMLEKMSTKLDPCDDFYDYACGGYVTETKIPTAFYHWHEIYRLGIDAFEAVKYYILDPASDFSASQLKAADLYKSCMDRSALKRVGLQPLQQFLARVGEWPLQGAALTERDFQATLSTLYDTGFYPILWVGVVVDDMNTSRHAVMVDQAVLSLQNRGMYVNETTNEIIWRAESAALQALYQLVFGVAKLLGASDSLANRTADETLRFEAKLAQIVSSNEDKTDASKSYHLTTLSRLGVDAPFLDWQPFLHEAFLKREHFAPNEPIIVNDIAWLRSLSGLVEEFQSTPEKRLIMHNYMKWRAVANLVTFLDTYALPEDIRYILQAIVPAFNNRFIFCISRTMQITTMPLASLYVRMQPDLDTVRQDAAEIVELLTDVMIDEVKSLEWMDDPTKETALQKTVQMIALVGYPDVLTNFTALDALYVDLTIKPEEFFFNMLRGMKFIRKLDLMPLRRVPSRESWTIDANPLRANAFYSFKENRIVIPAALLSPPVYTHAGPRSVNLGSLGTIAGHELTHAFDGKGREYDEMGNIRQWWSETAALEYSRRSECLVHQYSTYQVLNANINGKMTQSENLADNGALKLAYRAFKRQQTGDTNIRYPGTNMTDEQMFFLSFAQTWCSKATSYFRQYQLQTDEHAHEKFRVLGSLHNMPEFSRAFECAAGSNMNPLKKCEHLW